MTSRRFTVLVPSMSNVLWQRVCLGEGSENSVSSRVWVFFLQGIFLHGGVFFGRFRAFDVKMNSDYAIDTPRFLAHNISRCSSSSENLHLSISEYQEAWTKTWSHLDIDQLQPKRRDVSFEAQLKCRMPPESEFDYEAATCIWVFSFLVREGRLNSTCLVLSKLIPSLLKPLSTS